MPSTEKFYFSFRGNQWIYIISCVDEGCYRVTCNNPLFRGIIGSDTSDKYSTFTKILDKVAESNPELRDAMWVPYYEDFLVKLKSYALLKAEIAKTLE